MKFEARKEGLVIVIKFLEKSLDASIAEDFRETMINLVENDNTLFVLDISNVVFIDSRYLGVMISCLKLVGKDGNIAISGIKDSVMNVFKLTRMDAVFQLFDNEKEALKALST
jgi:anti-sigma B factor antagonist